jgi:hypothetical protein
VAGEQTDTATCAYIRTDPAAPRCRPEARPAGRGQQIMVWFRERTGTHIRHISRRPVLRAVRAVVVVDGDAGSSGRSVPGVALTVGVASTPWASQSECAARKAASSLPRPSGQSINSPVDMYGSQCRPSPSLLFSPDSFPSFRCSSQEERCDQHTHMYVCICM